MRYLTVLWGATIISMSLGCQGRVDPAPKLETIRLCGSSTMGARLAPRLVARWLGLDAPFPELHHAIRARGWCTTGRPFGGGQEVRVCVEYRGFSEAEAQLGSGRCEIGMFSGPWHGAPDGPIRAVSVGRDAIMIVTSHDSPLGSVSVSKLASWYGGTAKPEGVRVISRAEETSGTSAALAAKLGLDRVRAAGWNRMPADAFAELVAGGGAWVYYVSAQEQLSASGFRVLGVRPHRSAPVVRPTLDVLAAELYPLVRELSFLVMKDSASTVVGGFLAWVQTAEARPIFESLAMWHVTSATVDRARLSRRCGAAAEASDWIVGERVASVYFGRRRSRVPSRSWAEGYLIANVQRAADAGRDLRIIGYSSDIGDTKANCRLAKARAEGVRKMALAMKRRLGIERRAAPDVRVVVGGPTRFWGRKPQNNRVVMIFSTARQEL